MGTFSIRKGYDIRIAGKPEERIFDAPAPVRVALKPGDFYRVKPRLLVEEGAEVRAGQIILQDKNRERIVFASPAGGKVVEIKRGDRRALLEIIIEISNREEFEFFDVYDAEHIRGASREELVDLLLKSGMWPLLRQHPFGLIPDPTDVPRAIFVSMLETEPCQPDPRVVLYGKDAEAHLALELLKKISGGKVHVSAGDNPPYAFRTAQGVEKHLFRGSHPAGNPRIQGQIIDPPKQGEFFWHLRAQELLALGQFLMTGKYPVERIVSLAGTGVKAPRYIRSRLGASADSLHRNDFQTAMADLRLVSGSVLTGNKIEPSGFLGFYDSILHVLPEAKERKFLGWADSGEKKESIFRAFLANFLPAQEFAHDTSLNGSPRAIIPMGAYERVCPLDIYPTFLVKTVIAGDLEEAEKLGLLECGECGLCSYVCPSKTEFASIIRKGLDDYLKEV